MALTKVQTNAIADDAVTTDKLANAINTERTANTAKVSLADNSVTLAKMAGGTDGQIITYDASGDPVAVGPGTDGQVLTSTGAGSPPAFETLPTSGATLSGSTNNTVVTVTGSNAMTGEANLTFTGSSLTVTNDSGASEVTLVTPNNTDGGVYFNDGSNQGAVTYLHTDDSMKFRVNGTNKMQIDSSGDVCIGTTAPITAYNSSGTKLTIHDGNNAGGTLELSAQSNGAGDNAGMISFYNDNNSNATQFQAASKLVGIFRAETVTTDSNAGDDSGADFAFYTKPEAAAGYESMRIHGEGYVTKPKHPVASAFLNSSSTAGASGNKIGNAICVYNDEHFDIGGVYDTSNGRFTAPVAGVYRISVSGNMKMDNYAEGDWYSIKIYKNGSEYWQNYNYARGEAWEYQNFTNLIQLAASDYIQIGLYGHNGQTMGWDADGNGAWHRAQFELIA